MTTDNSKKILSHHWPANDVFFGYGVNELLTGINQNKDDYFLLI